MDIKAKAIILVPSIVFVIVMAFLILGSFITIAFGIPCNLGLPLLIRMVGLLAITIGLFFLGWLFKYRKPMDILVSTYLTFSKMVKKSSLEDRSRRTEPLVVKGPYKYVRHPIYYSVVVMVLGFGLLLDYSFMLFSAILLLIWFNFVVARFEEEELKAIFGEHYEHYLKEVSRIIPFLKLGKGKKRRRKL